MLIKSRLRLVFLQTQLIRDRDQILAREAFAAREQKRVRLPELPMRSRKLGELGREVGSGMKLGIGQVAPNQTEPVEAVEKRHHRTIGGVAEAAAEVPILDKGERW